VLVRHLAFDGKHKIANKWDEDIYIIISQPNISIPVFEVAKENDLVQRRTLHRNHLLPIGSLPLDSSESVKQNHGHLQYKDQGISYQRYIDYQYRKSQ